jgi:hypothetical protein
MPILKHPLSGATYTVREDGLVEVENNGKLGLFQYDGRYVSGELRQADPHFLLWLAGPQLPPDAAGRRHRGG